MNYLLLAGSVLGLTANNVCTKLFVRDAQRTPAAAFGYNAGYSAFGALLFLILFFATGQPMPQTVTWITAATNGVFFAMCLLFSTLAFSSGSMSLSGVIINSAFCVPMIYSYFMWQEPFTVTNIAGVVLLLVTFVLSSQNQKAADNKKVNGKWLLCVIAAFIGGGAGAVLGKQQQKTTGGADRLSYMFICYTLAAVLLFVIFLILSKRGAGRAYENNFGYSRGKLAALCAVSGVTNGVGNLLIISLAITLPAVVLYPVANGGLAILLSVASIAFFKEKLTLRLGAAILCGVAAILLLTL